MLLEYTSGIWKEPESEMGRKRRKTTGGRRYWTEEEVTCSLVICTVRSFDYDYRQWAAFRDQLRSQRLFVNYSIKIVKNTTKQSK